MFVERIFYFIKLFIFSHPGHPASHTKSHPKSRTVARHISECLWLRAVPLRNRSRFGPAGANNAVDAATAGQKCGPISKVRGTRDLKQHELHASSSPEKQAASSHLL